MGILIQKKSRINFFGEMLALPEKDCYNEYALGV